MLKRIVDGIRLAAGLQTNVPRLVFLHLPRTGGTALTKDILFQSFPQGRWCHVNYNGYLQPQAGSHDPLRWSAAKRARIRLLAGHMPFGFASHFPGPSEYVTILREPVARTVSDYFYCRHNAQHPAYAMAQELSLVQFVERGYGLTHNCYAHWLSNASFGTSFSAEEQMLQRARQNLAAFALVGVTESLETSIARICQRYGLKQRPFSTENRNAATPHRRPVSAEERKVIEHYNELDLLLYEEARQRFMRDEPLFASDRAMQDTPAPVVHT